MENKSIYLFFLNVYRCNQTTERQLARPPAEAVQVDSDNAREEWNKHKFLSDRDPRWRPDFPTQPLFKREQHVFLPLGADRVIQEMSAAPVKQRTVNTLQTPKPDQYPNPNSVYPVDFNPNTANPFYKPKPPNHAKFLHNPEYYEWLRNKVDLDIEPQDGKMMGLTDQEPRIYQDGPGIPSDITQEPIIQYRNEDIEQKEIHYTDGNQTISDPIMEPLNPSYHDDRTFEERQFIEQGRADIESKRNTNPLFHDNFQQNEIVYNDGNQMIEQEINAPAPRNATAFHQKQIEYQDHRRQEIEDHLPVKRTNFRDEYLQLVKRRYEDAPDELENTSERLVHPVRPGMTEDSRHYANNERMEMITTDKKGFKRLVSLIEQRSPSYKDNTRNELNNAHSIIQNHNTLSLQEHVVNYADAAKMDVSAQQRINDIDIRGQVDGKRHYADHAKIDINGRKFKTLDSRGLETKSVTFQDSLKNADVDAKMYNAKVRNENIQEKLLEKMKAPKMQVDTEKKQFKTLVGLRDLNPRITEQHKNADMNIPYTQGAKFSRVLKDKPRPIAEPNKIDYDEPFTKVKDNLPRIRGYQQNVRPKSLNVPSKIEIDSPYIKATGPQIRRVNTSNPNTPRQTPCKRNDEEIERIQKFMNLPNPF